MRVKKEMEDDPAGEQRAADWKKEATVMLGSKELKVKEDPAMILRGEELNVKKEPNMTLGARVKEEPNTALICKMKVKDEPVNDAPSDEQRAVDGLIGWAVPVCGLGELTREVNEMEEHLKMMDAEMEAINNAQLMVNLRLYKEGEARARAYLEAMVDRVLVRHCKK